MSNEMLIMPTRTRRIDGLTIRYTEIDAADGPVILLTSPWPESLLAYRRVWPALATRARLVAIDLPGFGHSQGRTDLFRPDAMAEFLHRLIGEFELGSPHLVAPDVGTSAALFLAARHPGAVKSLIVGSGASAWPLETGGVLATSSPPRTSRRSRAWTSALPSAPRWSRSPPMRMSHSSGRTT
jgi:pimeloyl-ACP methyl ester carboxylesterase